MSSVLYRYYFWISIDRVQRSTALYHSLGGGDIKMSEYTNNKSVKGSSHIESVLIDTINIGNRFRRDLGDLRSLVESISEIGLLHPIVVNSKSKTLLAGQRRLQACKILGWLEVPVHYVNLDDIIKGEYHENVVRKEFTFSELVELKKAIEPIEREQAKKRQRVGQIKGGKNRINTIINSINELGENYAPSNINNNSNGVIPNAGKTRDKLANYTGVSHTTLEKAEKIYNAAKEHPETYGVLLEKLDQNKISIDKAFHQMKKLQKKDKFSKEKPIMVLPEGIKLYNEDFRSCSIQIPDKSIDLILTDPPYDKSSLSLYNDLALVAQRVLKPAGSLITYCGTYALEEILQYMKIAGLKYHWIFAIKLEGPFAKFWEANVTVKWKPMLWFVKGNKPNLVDFVGDLIESNTPQKVSHEWEQSMVEAEHIISRLTVENQSVFDPMLGSGSFGEVALKLKRNFIGIEIDQETFETANTRLAKVINGTRKEGISD